MYILIGCGMIVLCMSIQVIVASVLLQSLNTLVGMLEDKPIIKHPVLSFWTLITGVSLLLLAGNLLQATLWAWIFFGFDEFKDFGTSFYHSLVNFTTLGYGDLVLSDERRILGALEAANGVMMLGLTTSVLYSTVRALMQRRRQKKRG